MKSEIKGFCNSLSLKDLSWWGKFIAPISPHFFSFCFQLSVVKNIRYNFAKNMLDKFTSCEWNVIYFILKRFLFCFADGRLKTEEFLLRRQGAKFEIAKSMIADDYLILLWSHSLIMMRHLWIEKSNCWNFLL